MFGEGGATSFSMHRTFGDIADRCPVALPSNASIRASAWVQARAVAMRWGLYLLRSQVVTACAHLPAELRLTGIRQCAGPHRRARGLQQRMYRWTPCQYIGWSQVITLPRSCVVGAAPCRLPWGLSSFLRPAKKRQSASQMLHCLNGLRAKASSPCSTSWTDELRCFAALCK